MEKKEKYYNLFNYNFRILFFKTFSILSLVMFFVLILKKGTFLVGDFSNFEIIFFEYFFIIMMLVCFVTFYIIALNIKKEKNEYLYKKGEKDEK